MEMIQQAYQQSGVNGVLIALLCASLAAIAVMYKRQNRLEDAARELQGTVIKALTEGTAGASRLAEAVSDLTREVREALRR